MAEITTTQAFSDGDTVTATKLNNITANAALQTEAITNRSAETTVDQANDLLLMYDASATALKKITLSNAIKAGTASNFPVTGNATIGGTLGVTGASTLTGNATVGGTLGVTGASTLTGNTSVGGTLGVTGVLSASSTIELGHASDTTLARGAAGRLQVEGVDVPTISSTDTLTNKTLTSPTINTGTISGGTINNASIGATTPSTGAFTGLTLNSVKVDAFPTGTVLLFFQAAAPTGWTQVTTQNNKALRVVSGTGGGTGGSVNFTTAFASQNVGDTTLSANQIPAHTHGVSATTGTESQDHTHSFSAQQNAYAEPTIFVQGAAQPGMWYHAITGNTGGRSASHTHSFSTTSANNSTTGSSHTHTLNIAVQYIDVILCSKNA